MKIEDFNTHRINVTELAKLMDYSRPHICEIVSGLRQPTAKFLRALEKIPLEKVRKKYIFRNVKDKSLTDL